MKFNGFSDHTMDIIAPIVFVALKNQLGAKSLFIEKHVKVPHSKGPDASTSIDTNQLREMVSNIQSIK